MAKRGLHFSVQMNADGREASALVRQWEARGKYVGNALAYHSADYMRRFVQAKMPNTGTAKTLRNSLEVAKVQGLKKGQVAYSVQIDTKKPSVQKIAPRRVLITVLPKRGPVRRDPRIDVLVKHNPWTLNTLPFKPSSSKAILITKRATGKVVWAVTEKRRKEESIWRKELLEAGLRYKKTQQLRVPRNIENMPNVAVEALQLEFGLGGTKPKPSWRLAAGQLRKTGAQTIAKSPQITKAMSKLADRNWKKGPPRVKHSISIGSTRQYDAFIQKLGLG